MEEPSGSERRECLRLLGTEAEVDAERERGEGRGIATLSRAIALDTHRRATLEANLEVGTGSRTDVAEASTATARIRVRANDRAACIVLKEHGVETEAVERREGRLRTALVSDARFPALRTIIRERKEVEEAVESTRLVGIADIQTDVGTRRDRSTHLVLLAGLGDAGVVLEERGATERELNEDTLLLQAFRRGIGSFRGGQSFGRTIDRSLRFGVDRLFRRRGTSRFRLDRCLLFRDRRIESTELLGVTLQRRVEGVDLGRSLGRQLLRIVRRGLSRGNRSAVVDDAARTLDRGLGSGSDGISRCCHRRRARNGSGGGRSGTSLGGDATNRRSGATSSLLALVLVRQRRRVRVRYDVQNAVAVRIHEPVASRRVQLAADIVDGAVASLAGDDILEQPQLSGALGRDRTAEALRKARDDDGPHGEAVTVGQGTIGVLLTGHVVLAVVVDAVLPDLLGAGVDLSVIVVAVAALEAGGQDAGRVADGELVAILVVALRHLRECVHGGQRGREGQQQGKLLHRELLGGTPQVIGNTTVPSGCRAWETYPLLHSRHPEGLTRSLRIHSFEELHPRPVQINQ